MMGDDGRSQEQIRHLSPNRNKERRSRGGPRSLYLKRSENGFGFTLRHFVVYPPESNSVLSNDRRYGLRGGPSDRPMDTIFVKSVRPGSGAAIAGLSAGDQLVSVNGEPITGRSYAQVVHLIQASPSYLHLLVVPKEEDLLQLYYGETAHNPKTNQRPHSRSRGSPHHSPAASSSPARRAIENSPSHFQVKMPAEPDYSGGSDSMTGGGYSLPSNIPHCRLSFDGGSSRRESQETTQSSDDSVIMSRIRRSLEQKEEFLRGATSQSPTPLKEFYSRPQKLQPPVWPPAIPASSVGQPLPKEIVGNGQPLTPRGFVYGGPVTNAPMMDNCGRYTARLGRIQERHSSPPIRQMSPPARSSSPMRQTSPPVRQGSPLSTIPPLRIVSERARQFETGLCLADKTDLYRSELARLNKKNVPNVAVRRKEFESRALDWRQHRESRSLDSTTTGSLSPTPTGNRTIPIGSTKIHCDPPEGYHDASEFTANENSERQTTRPRSNSVEGIWSDRMSPRSTSSDPPQRHKAVRQDSYLAAVKKPVQQVEVKKSGDEVKTLEIKILPATPTKRPQRPTRLDLSETNQPALSIGSEDERATRRVSYLKATWADRGHLESDLELSDNEPILSPHRRAFRKWRPPLFPDDIQKIVRLFEPLPTIYDSCVVAVPQKDQEATIEGPLYYKLTQIDGKKASDRSWRTVWAIVRSEVLYIFRDKKDANSETPVDHEMIELNNSTVSQADDYTKRRHVFRLSTPSSSEILLQAESADEMTRWISALSKHDALQQVPTGSLQNVSPVTAHKGLMKNITTTFRNRSPTGQLPVNKNRKPSQNEVPVGTAKSKTWKVRVAKQLKKIQSGSGSPVSPTAPISYQEGATIGVPLELCPRSKCNEFVPLLVELCTGIVEERGLDIIGIYRVPGNTAAITSLTDAVNKGLKEALMDQDQRWSDVNVISSLLKLFFRKLPDCLLTTELYPNFIKADKIEDPKMRIVSIRKLVHELPDHHHHTLKHLMMHLKLVVEHSIINKMEARNLAIVFGPTLVRAADDNMVTMVTDMSHQCRIVETLIQHADWCFGDESLDRLRLQEAHDNGGQILESDSALPNQSLLLGNVHKLEGMKGVMDVSRRDIVTSIITAANKKMKGKARKQISSTSEELQPDKGDKHKDGNRKGSGDGIDGEMKSVACALASGVRETAMFSKSMIVTPQLDNVEKEVEEKCIETAAVKPPTSNDGTIVTYTGLSETTQERIRRFEMETKAMLQRDKMLNTQFLRPIAPPAIGNKIAEKGKEGQKADGLTPLDKWRQITSPPQKETEGDKARLARCGSLDSLTESYEQSQTPMNNNINEAIVGGVDLVSSLTLTFDAKMKSLGLISPTEAANGENCEESEDGKSFRDPSLHRSFTSPNLEFKTLELPIVGNLKEEEKIEVEKDDEKENQVINGGKLKRSESFNKREEKKDNKLLRRSESLNKKDSSMNKLKRSDSLTKTEKTDLNISKRKQALEAATKKMKRKTGGGSERSIKRRHTVGGTKDFDKAAWLDNKEREVNEERRSSSPDLSADIVRPILVLRPHSVIADSPLESHM
ncbi:rho GTPase-activating protein 21-A isoform X3 [Cimex lectularius]|uniref:Rho GTPase-activating protein 21 n=1 Tax=Cimex lectularius TaxID=79782 RepID=A0A8I6RFN8_CIMLE|nr:rho GTPase-activating protein 21-A isoform X3 [Cimex lectularius]